MVAFLIIMGVFVVLCFTIAIYHAITPGIQKISHFTRIENGLIKDYFFFEKRRNKVKQEENKIRCPHCSPHPVLAVEHDGKIEVQCKCCKRPVDVVAEAEKQKEKPIK